MRPINIHPHLRRTARQHARPRLLRAIERDAADRRLRLLLNLVLSFASAVPVRQDETGLLDEDLELLVAVCRARTLVAERLRFCEQSGLNLAQQLVDVRRRSGERHAELLAVLAGAVAARRRAGQLLPGPLPPPQRP